MAIYTNPDLQELKSFIEEYKIGKLNSVEPIIDGIENSNFTINTSTGKFILTIYEKRLNENDLPFFIGLLNHSIENGLKCPKPIPRNDGKIYGILSGRPANIFSYIKGKSLNEINNNHCKEVGKILAIMHQKTKNFKAHRKNDLSLPEWKILWKKCLIYDIDDHLKKEIDYELDFLKNFWPKNLPTGIIHADLFPDNVLFCKNHIAGLIDFYFACNDFLMYDFAVCFNAWCFNKDNAYDQSKGKAIFEGYNEIRKISKDELLSLPILLRGSAMRFFLTRFYDAHNIQCSDFVIIKDPAEYIHKIKFHKNILSISQYGF
ncbi:homoserine kinase [Candidatus Liberibacter americanus]|uniref:Homoserine kinase n=1 Tax=Candidatus Liberibacter americanus str. Sao Paulo TaxID=1261131 RepID=U6B3L9_9HYPH|nr:homoserine kinase [Candidatus Liberibacter americanus]AHA27535.1 Putative homoserine kinase type II [Candidatus Liberibacter americanus str. Sao Paulo]EMS36504.1 homoserine kinase [Candidatus Liberibacter americanus PW_SP]